MVTKGTIASSYPLHDDGSEDDRRDEKTLDSEAVILTPYILDDCLFEKADSVAPNESKEWMAEGEEWRRWRHPHDDPDEENQAANALSLIHQNSLFPPSHNLRFFAYPSSPPPLSSPSNCLFFRILPSGVDFPDDTIQSIWIKI